jgi:signal transduction histidine kinase
MFSRISSSVYRTAAWRLALRSTLVFAAGSAAVFAAMYVMVAQTVRERSDSWLIGESETLRQVAVSTSKDALYPRIVEEIAELATQEVAYDAYGNRYGGDTVFFLQTSPGQQEPVWVGPSDSRSFLDAIRKVNLRERSPVSIRVAGWPARFRVVAADMGPDGGRIYLGLQDHAGAALLRKLLLRFFLGWMCMVGFGFFIALVGLRRTLKRVDAITSAAASIGSNDLGNRVAMGAQNDEITRLAQTLNNMLDRISASVNQLRTVTDSIAHDMKSPITSVRGSLEVALSAENEDESRELVAKAIENLDRLSEIVTTSLDVAEAEAGALRLRLVYVDLTELFHRVAELYAPAFAEHHQVLEVVSEAGIAVQADLRLITRALSNLMENELRYAGEGAQIRFVLAREGGAARIMVEDNGPGFPAEVLPNVFQRFVKGNLSEGHGLGLAFVHAVASAHGGTAIAENILLEGGACVTVLIPLIVSAPERKRAMYEVLS